MVLVAEHNQYAYSTPTSNQMNIKDLVQRAEAYGIPSKIVDGNDVEAVYEATAEAADFARQGGGPFLLECKTMRMTGHAAHDDARYVPAELFEEWKGRDPLDSFRPKAEKAHGAKAIEALEAEIEELLDRDEAFALQSPAPDPEQPLWEVFAS